MAKAPHDISTFAINDGATFYNYFFTLFMLCFFTFGSSILAPFMRIKGLRFRN